MSKTATSKPTDGSNAFTIAAMVLGVIAFVQVGAVVWFVAQYEPKQTRKTTNDAAVDGAFILSAPTAPVAANSETPKINRTHAVANIPTIDPASATPPAIAEPRESEVSEDVAIQNKAALYYLDQGMALRNDGDMQGALVHFNSAASLEKDHPRILYEFAITYEEMRLTSKAANFWDSIFAMGPVRGGDYYSLADFRIKGQLPETGNEIETSLDTLAGPVKKILKIASAIAEPDNTVAEGERVVLNVLIKSPPGSLINPQYVHVRVDFYDIVNEETVDLTRAVPANRWVTQPVDWQNQSEELLEVTYFLPPQADQEILDFGQRTYHGYVIKVFYHDQIQDAKAEPADLLDSIDLNSPLQEQTPTFDDSFFPR
ncbi:MAG: tetratricopeptide (TPR) repeat protein [Verrucomicrobiales bacterium]|jgi:tetratricopeptide (TPR) repeat protein